MEELQILRNLINEDEDCFHVIWGYETAPDTGTPHFQGHVSFATQKRLNYVRNILPRAHWSVSRMVDNAIEYCMKPGNPYEEYGLRPTRGLQGKRTDLDDFKDSVLSGIYCKRVLREQHSEVCAKYPRFVNDYLDDHLPQPELPVFPLRPWQQTLNAKLLLPPNERKIIFLVDYEGNQGKSWFAQYFCSLHDRSQVILPGRKADMCYVLERDIRYLFIDAPRSKQGEYLQYDFLEDVKNGYVFSPKYESRIKRLGPVHLVVNMNEDPDMTKLSRDRYEIIRLG